MFEEADLIHRYTRADALRDGVLIDVSAAAREAGIRWPVALTAATWTKCVTVPPGVVCQDAEHARWWQNGRMVGVPPRLYPALTCAADHSATLAERCGRMPAADRAWRYRYRFPRRARAACAASVMGCVPCPPASSPRKARASGVPSSSSS
jgi:hypothetical protein